MIYVTHYDSLIGKIRLRATEGGLIGVDHVNQQAESDDEWVEDGEFSILVQAKSELDEYFQGERRSFETPLKPQGTDFQLQVWEALKAIPYGETRSYGEIASQIRKPKAVRAVGAANGRNPLSIFIPCHRVIGKSGKLVGYAGGMEAKTALLKLEKALKV